MISVRLYRQQEYGLLKSWFDAYEWECYPEDCISPDSFIAECDNKPVVFSSLYFTVGSKLALLGFTIADPESDKNIRREAIVKVIKHIEEHAINNGYEHIYYFTDNARMVKVLSEQLHWEITDNGTAYILAKSLKETTRKFLIE